MKDVTGNEIKNEDIIIFSKRDERRQSVGFGIVVEANHRYGTDIRIKTIPLSSKHARMGVFKVGYKLMSSGTPIVHLQEYQVFVVKDPTTLADGIVEALRKALDLQRQVDASAVVRTAEKKMSAGERFSNHSARKREDDAIAQAIALQQAIDNG